MVYVVCSTSSLTINLVHHHLFLALSARSLTPGNSSPPPSRLQRLFFPLSTPFQSPYVYTQPTLHHHPSKAFRPHGRRQESKS